MEYAGSGQVYGVICICLAALDHILLWFLEWLYPAVDVDRVVPFPVTVPALRRTMRPSVPHRRPTAVSTPFRIPIRPS